MKIILRLLKWITFGVLGLAALLFLLLVLDPNQHHPTHQPSEISGIKPQKEFIESEVRPQYDSLLSRFGQNKVLAPGFELQCLLALSHYPELKDANIAFQIKPTFLPLASRPDPVSVVFPWIKRKYLVIISNASADFFEPILLKNTPFNEQIGIIGHELAHSVYYLDKSSLELAWIAYKYEYDDRFHTQFERETDKRAIAHGLGYQMYDFAFFVRKAFGNTQEEIAQEEGDTYLSPKEIAVEMERYDFYLDSLDETGSYFLDLIK